MPRLISTHFVATTNSDRAFLGRSTKPPRTMILTTKTKVACASVAYRVIAGARRFAGKDNWATVRRRGILWHLDLSEGIDLSIYLLGAFERSTAVALDRLVRPGDVAFDIGANIGAHTLGLALRTGSTGCVFAFEPTDFAFAKLKRNLELNPQLQGQTRIYQTLLADALTAPREAEIYASWPLRANAQVHAKHRGLLASTSNASVDTLDEFVEREGIERLDLIKIDVDGHEYPVLTGGRRTLEKFRPILVMELSPYVHAEKNEKFRDLIALLRENGYSLQDATSGKPLPLESDELEALIPDGASINVIARARGATL